MAVCRSRSIPSSHGHWTIASVSRSTSIAPTGRCCFGCPDWGYEMSNAFSLRLGISRCAMPICNGCAVIFARRAISWSPPTGIHVPSRLRNRCTTVPRVKWSFSSAGGRRGERFQRLPPRSTLAVGRKRSPGRRNVGSHPGSTVALRADRAHTVR